MDTCPVCYQKNNFSLLKRDGEIQVSKCGDCGSIYSNLINCISEISTSKAHLGDHITINLFNLLNFLLNRYVSKLIADFDFK